MFARIKPLGWGFQELLTSGQMTQLDLDHANAVDGAGGGDYGAPLAFSNLQDTQVNGSFTVGANDYPFKVPGSIYVGDRGIASIGGIVTTQYLGASGAHPDQGWGMRVVERAELAGGVHGDGAYLKLLGPGETLEVRGDALFDAGHTTQFAGAAQFLGPITPMGPNARIRARPFTTLDADGNYDVSQGDLFLIPFLTANRNYFLVDANAGANDVCEFSATDNNGGFAANLFSSDGSGPFTLANSGSVSNSYIWMKFRHTGVHWRFVGYGKR